MKLNLLKNFRRLTAKSGSVMVIVVVIMASLIALATAILHSINKERNELLNFGDKEQIYQMTAAANAFFYDYLELYFSSVDNGRRLRDLDDDLVKAMLELLPGGARAGESLEFDEVLVNRFLEVVSSSGDAVYKHQTIIEYVVSESQGEMSTGLEIWHYFDISTTGYSKNIDNEWSADENVITRRVMFYEYVQETLPDGEIPPGTPDNYRFFTVAFGMSGPSYARVSSETGQHHTMYMGNRLALFSGGNHFNSKLSVFGDLRADAPGGSYFGEESPVELNIRGSFTHTNSGNLFPKGGVMRVGSFLDNYKGTTGPASDNPTIIYILGRETTTLNGLETVFRQPSENIRNTIFFINGDVSLQNNSTLFADSSVKFFINGNLALSNLVRTASTFYVSGDIILTNHSNSNVGSNLGSATFYFGGKITAPEMMNNADSEMDNHINNMNAQYDLRDEKGEELSSISGQIEYIENNEPVFEIDLELIEDPEEREAIEEERYNLVGHLYIQRDALQLELDLINQSGIPAAVNSFNNFINSSFGSLRGGRFRFPDGTPYNPNPMTGHGLESFSSEEERIFPWGTTEAWPVYRTLDEDLDINELYFPQDSVIQSQGDFLSAIGLGADFEFETIEECFEYLNRETVERTFGADGKPKLTSLEDYDSPYTSDGKVIMLSHVLSPDGEIIGNHEPPTILANGERKEIVGKVLPRYVEPDVEEPPSGKIAKLEYQFVDYAGGENPDYDEPDYEGPRYKESDWVEERLSPQVFPQWDVDANLNNWGFEHMNIKTSKETGNRIVLNSELNGAFLPDDDGIIHVTDHGYIDTMADWDQYRRLIIDTTVGVGVDPDNPTTHRDIYIRLCTTDEWTNPRVFKWAKGNNIDVKVLVRGAGSVVFFMDTEIDPITGTDISPVYDQRDIKGLFIGHEAWTLETHLSARSDRTVETIMKHIHPEAMCESDARSFCFYCRGAALTDEKSPGAFLLKQFTSPSFGSNLIAKYSKPMPGYTPYPDHPLFLHNNIFIVNNNHYGQIEMTDEPFTAANLAQQPYTRANRYYPNDVLMYGYIYSPFSTSLVHEKDNIHIGANLSASYIQTTDDQNVAMVHLMPANYYAGLVRPNQTYQPDFNMGGFNPHKFTRDVVSRLHGEAYEEGDTCGCGCPACVNKGGEIGNCCNLVTNAEGVLEWVTCFDCKCGDANLNGVTKELSTFSGMGFR
ncbi:MAG: hypothetical protein FWH05_06480 [Oscillospiraceae bacterium]|nr:hypothetical protein [Oscillospiraceae bacterium]